MLRQPFTPRLGKEPKQQAWYIYWKDPVRRHWRRFSTGTNDRAQAEYALGEFLVKHSLDIGCEEIRPPESFFIETALRQYISDRKHKNDLATIGLATRCADSLIKFFGSRAKVSHLTPQALEQYGKERTRKPRVLRKKSGLEYVEDKRPVTKGTVRRVLSVLSSALSHAIKYRRLTSAPKIYKPAGGENRKRFLNKFEIGKLLANCIADHVRLFIILAINTGARRGALLDLKWGQVDLNSRIIYLNPNGREQTKKFRSIVPVNDALFEVLTKAKRDQDALVSKNEEAGQNVSVCEHVIAYNGQPIKCLRAAFHRSCQRAGLEDVTPHTLRHTAGTLMALAGIDFYLISRVLCHSVQTTTELYAHFAPDHLRRAVSVLGDAMPTTVWSTH